MKEERNIKRSNRFKGETIMLTQKKTNKHDTIFINEFGATLKNKKQLLNQYFQNPVFY